MNIAIKEPQQAQAWRIAFSDSPLNGEPPLILEPRPVWVKVTELDAADVLASMVVGASATSGLVIICLPPGDTTPLAVRKQVDAWVATQPSDRGNLLEVHTTSGQFLWRPGRAACFGRGRRPGRAACFGRGATLEDAIVGLIHFTFCEDTLTDLERRVQCCWAGIERDKSLMGRMTPMQLKRQQHIEAMARKTTGLRVSYTRLMSALETPHRQLTGADRRLFLELTLQADAVDRLRMLDGATEVLMEFYQHEREHFGEFRYHLSEYRLLVIIVLLILIQLCIPNTPLTVAFMDLFNWLTAAITVGNQVAP